MFNLQKTEQDHRQLVRWLVVSPQCAYLFQNGSKNPEVYCTLRSSSFVALAVVLHFCFSHTNKHSGKKKIKHISNTFRMEAASWALVHLH